MRTSGTARIIVVVVCLVLVGCVSTAEIETPDIVPTTPAHTDTPLARVDELATSRADWLTALQATRTVVALTPTRTHLPTRTPTITPTPTRTPTPTESVPLTEEGPWLVFLASTEPNETRYLWAINADGTGLTKLSEERILSFGAQPTDSLENGVRIAYITQPGWYTGDIEMKMITLPGGEVETITPLLDETNDLEGFDAYNLINAIDYGGVSWSPDGSRLAFVGVLDGEFVDVYAYDIYDKTITRLTDSPTHAFDLLWSPDGRFVIHKSFCTWSAKRERCTDVWAARADGLGTISLIEASEEGETNDVDQVRFYEWLNSSMLYLGLTYHVGRTYYVGDSDVRLVNVETGETRYIIKEEFAAATFAKEYNTWLLTRSYSPDPEMTLILVQNGEMSELPGNLINHVWWSGLYDLFVGLAVDGQVYTISPGGDISKLPIYAKPIMGALTRIITSPDESLWA